MAKYGKYYGEWTNASGYQDRGDKKDDQNYENARTKIVCNRKDFTMIRLQYREILLLIDNKRMVLYCYKRELKTEIPKGSN